MTGLLSFTDARGAMRAWSLTRTATLVGPGKPLTNGVHLSVRDSPGPGTYAVVVRAGGGDHEGGMPVETPRLSFSVWGPDWGKAEDAAIALARELVGLQPITVTTARGTNVRLLQAGNVTMLQSADGTRPRFIVDADVWCAPAA